MKSLAALILGLFLCVISARAEIQIDESKLAQLAVQERGRKKPMTTLAQESLLTLTGSSLYRANEEAKPQSAASVMIDLWLQPEKWETRPIILISYLPLKEKMGLPRETKLFSYSEVTANSAFRALVSETQQMRVRDPKAELTPLQKEAQQVAQRLNLFESWAQGRMPAIVPHPHSISGTWVSMPALRQYYDGLQAEAAESKFIALKETYQRGDTAAFNTALESLTAQMISLSQLNLPVDENGNVTSYLTIYPSVKMLSFEYFYQKFHPFRWAWVAYALALIIFALTSEWKRDLGYKLGWLILLTGFFLQAFGFTCRIIISGRPPVTNMYETVIWLAFGTVFFAIILETIYRCRYFLMSAAPIAIISLILADTQPTILDSSIHPLVPVLRHNVWLIIHVLTITLSYAAFALALGLGHVTLLKTLSRKTRPADLNLLHLYLYRALQIGVLLLATGTILGGVWANYSWGRFWDWDPKETWALTTLLCYLALLHGRIAGWWSGFGLAVGSVLCFQAVLMAWYGVNFVLGKGLHSYGFGSGGYPVAAAFSATELLFVAIVSWIYYERSGEASSAKAINAPE